MKQIKSRNPLSGKAFFNKNGDLIMERGIKFGVELSPTVSPDEWFYLLLLACEEKPFPREKVEKCIKSWKRSRTTEWRMKNSLRTKGYLA